MKLTLTCIKSTISSNGGFINKLVTGTSKLDLGTLGSKTVANTYYLKTDNTVLPNSTHELDLDACNLEITPRPFALTDATGTPTGETIMLKWITSKKN